MKRRKILFCKRIGEYCLICTISSKIFYLDTLKQDELFDLIIRVQYLGNAVLRKRETPLYLVIGSSDFFTPIHEEDMQIGTHVFQLNLDELRKKDVMRVSLTVLANKNTEGRFKFFQTSCNIDNCVNLSMYTSNIFIKKNQIGYGERTNKKK